MDLYLLAELKTISLKVRRLFHLNDDHKFTFFAFSFLGDNCRYAKTTTRLPYKL